jgi:tetratricopeptide (TPR) repeat protein
MLPRWLEWLAQRRAVWAGVGLGLVVAAALRFSMCSTTSLAPGPAAAVIAESGPAISGSANRNPGYVGPLACMPCHTARVAEFQATRHYRACCRPDQATMPAGFAPGRGTFATPAPGPRFEMSAAGGSFFQTAIGLTPDGEETTSSRIDIVYGAAGTTDEIYFAWHDDRLYELPMVWLHPLNAWGTSPFDPHGRGDYSREMTLRCVECHNTWVEHEPGTLNQYRRDSLILGVTCENCHGPGRDHVAFHQNHPKAQEAHSIARPARLERERQIDLCAQCHSNAIKHRGPAFRYRPGERLDDYYRTLETRYPEDDHVANQVQYLRQSRCFEKSGTMTCTTCHDPHRPRDAAAAGSESCLACHAPADCGDHGRVPAAVHANCAGCHMPQLNKIQVYFRTENDSYLPVVKRCEHRIAVYPRAREEVLLEWHRGQTGDDARDEILRLKKSLADRWRDDADNYRRQHRYLAAINACRESLRFDPAPATREELQALLAIQYELDAGFLKAVEEIRERRHSEAIETLEKLLALKPDLARAHGRLGTVYAIVGKPELARQHLQAVAECDHDDPYGHAMLGWLAYLDGRPDVALEHYRRADEVEPYNAKMQHQMGLALVRLDRWPEAAERFRQALKIDPHFPLEREIREALEEPAADM